MIHAKGTFDSSQCINSMHIPILNIKKNPIEMLNESISKCAVSKIKLNGMIFDSFHSLSRNSYTI
jgi:hypothetical protein